MTVLFIVVATYFYTLIKPLDSVHEPEVWYTKLVITKPNDPTMTD